MIWQNQSDLTSVGMCKDWATINLGVVRFFAYFSVKRNVIKSQLWVYLFFSKVFPMIGNVTKVTLNFFLEKLDDIPCIIIFFLTLDRIVLIVALSHLSCPKRKFTWCYSFRFFVRIHKKGNNCTFSIGCNVSIFRNIPIYRDNWMSP